MNIFNPAFDVTSQELIWQSSLKRASFIARISTISSRMSVIEKKQELEAYFHDAGKTRDRWRVGTEYEKVGIDHNTGKAIPYYGPRGVEFILKQLIDRFGWEPEEQNGHIIALSRGNAQITLEPGGQIGFVAAPCDSIHCTYAEFTQHIRELIEVAEPLDIVFLGLGMQPISRLEEIEWVPKKRYAIMAPYMLSVGSLGQRMMKQTATVQANIDYLDERDAMAKFRTGMGLTPIVISMFANSPICDGQLNGYRSFREHIWIDGQKPGWAVGCLSRRTCRLRVTSNMPSMCRCISLSAITTTST